MGKFIRTVTDWRALAGAIALLLVGVHLSWIAGLYFTLGREAFGLMRTGWWWELALNFQIIAYFLMYICHAQRIKKHHGWRHRRAWYRLVLALAGLSTPSILLVVAAHLDWFDKAPDIDAVTYYSVIFFSCWFVAAYLLPWIASLFLGKKRLVYFTLYDGKLIGLLKYFSPLIILIVIFGVETLRGGYLHLVLWPVFTYYQGAVVYIDAAFSTRTKSERDPFEYVDQAPEDESVN
jgi:hypothetical protein